MNGFVGISCDPELLAKLGYTDDDDLEEEKNLVMMVKSQSNDPTWPPPEEESTESTQHRYVTEKESIGSSKRLCSGFVALLAKLRG